jgi:putative ABC transport system permease protein
MIANYLKVFIRLFFRQTAFTLINILGLAVGLACCLIIALFVRHEFSFDRFFANADMLYRVGTVAVAPNGTHSLNAVTFFPVAPLLEANFPAITEIARVLSKPTLISIGDADFYENEFKLVDPAFFRVFDFKWLEGDPASALTGATDVVLTRSFAEKYFGTESPLDQSLLLSEGVALRVTGVVEDLPGNTHLSGSTFAAMALRDVLEPVETRTREWLAVAYYTYVVLRPGVDIEQLQRELDAFGKANIPSPPFLSFTLTLDAVTGIHLNPVQGDIKPPGSKLNIAVFSAIGLGILLVACANFVNLSTARSAQRFGEVGLRLTLGARRVQLIGQFLGESVLFVLVAIVLALTIIELVLPGIQAFLELDLAVDSLIDPASLAILLGLGLFLGLAAGWYPALLMSRFRPALALKRQQSSLIRGIALKNLLVVLQFAIAIGMIVASIVIWSQLRFASALELGYVSNQVMVVTTNELGSLDRIRLLKERLLQSGDIAAAAISQSTPDRYGMVFYGNTESDETQRFLANFSVDSDYLSLYQIPLLAGRLLREDMPSDFFRTIGEGEEGLPQYEGSFVLNESGARQFGWLPEEAIGKRIADSTGSSYTVVGVVGDTIESAHVPARPALYALSLGEVPGRLLSLRLGDNPANALAFIDRTWKEINPDEPIIRSFLDDTIDARYRGDNRLMLLAFVFSAIAIFISCMGLFGLANFNAERRTREIGVRKVMGGSVWSIVKLLTNDFSRLVLLANVIAWPVAYFSMERWLQNFAYRIDLTPLVFIGSGLIALCIAWVTVGGTAAKAASQKPVLALRYE